MISQSMLIDHDLKISIPIKECIASPETTKSQMLQEYFKLILKKKEDINVSTIYKEQAWATRYDNWIGDIWKIKHPNLRNYRFKALIKDIFAKERMKRFGMSDSDLCEICGACESVQHQLFECVNARKIRTMAEQINPQLNIPDCYALIEVSADREVELLKCLIIKQLIQIDRSKMMTFDDFKKQYMWYSNIS